VPCAYFLEASHFSSEPGTSSRAGLFHDDLSEALQSFLASTASHLVSARASAQSVIRIYVVIDVVYVRSTSCLWAE